jgi:D-alanyl-D-alanine carboxypeptidase/D-alanyl-D-alanine-endopeptidase (penicillin-binding protein 4)
VTGDPLIALEELADQVAARGVKRIDGDIVGDDTWYLWQPFAAGWSVDDPQTDDGAAVSALTVNDNVINLNIRPGANAGDPAQVAFNPPVEYYNIENRVRTVAAGGERRIHIERVPGSLDLRVWGAIPLGDKGEDTPLGIDDPALYAGKAFRQLLEERGIVVAGEPVARHLYPHELASLTQAAEPPADAAFELARHTSAPRRRWWRICGLPIKSARICTRKWRCGRWRGHGGMSAASKPGGKRCARSWAKSGWKAGDTTWWMARDYRGST